MKGFVIIISVLMFAVARREEPCYHGNPEGYGPCGGHNTCSGINEECIQGVCCKVIGKPGEDRLCMVGKSTGYGPCDKDGTCPEHLECIETPEGDNICCDMSSACQKYFRCNC